MLYLDKQKTAQIRIPLGAIYMFRQFNIFILIFFTLNLLGQKTVFVGKVFDSTSQEPVPLADVQLLKSDSVISLTKSNFDGVFKFSDIVAGHYDLRIIFVGYKIKILQDITILDNQSDSLKIELVICKPPIIKECNICHRTDKVISIDNSIVTHYSFSSKAKEKKYYKKINSRGYQTAEINGKIILTDTKNPADNERIKQCGPCCELLFCERDKTIF